MFTVTLPVNAVFSLNVGWYLLFVEMPGDIGISSSGCSCCSSSSCISSCFSMVWPIWHLWK